METCLDEGTLQAYLDGELPPEKLNGVAAHLTACASCTEAARAAEQEFALFSTAFAHALSASVPTAELRARLDDAIAELNATTPRPFAPTHAGSRLRAFFGSIAASLTTFTPRQATAFAGFLVAVALVVVFALMQAPESGKTTGEDVAKSNQPTAPASIPAQVGNGPAREGIATAPPEQGRELVASAPSARREARAVFVKAGANVHPQVKSTGAEGVGATEVVNANAVAEKSVPVLEDEKTYISSIASLTTAIEAEGAAGLTPTLRAEYERNLAVVNQAIISSRVAARRNPQDTDAKEFLRAAYQNKVELLSAVADQAQIASGRD
jgi:anti-sigma factor RsiW